MKVYKISSTDQRDFLLWRMGSGRTVEIYDIAVNSDRRKGIGKSLVNDLMRRLPPRTKLVWAITRADNFIAQQFYEALHFRVVGVLRNFYNDVQHDTVDAIMYGKDVA